LPYDSATGEITLLAVANHLRAPDSAKGAQRGHEVNRLENIGLALGVVSQQEMKTGGKVHVQPRVITEIAQAYSSQMHWQNMQGGSVLREFFCFLIARACDRS